MVLKSLTSPAETAAAALWPYTTHAPRPNPLLHHRAPPAAATPSFTLNDGADWEDEDVMEQAVARVAAPAERRGNKPKHVRGTRPQGLH